MKPTTHKDPEQGPSFDLPVENELLMLKLKAEFGAECITGDPEIPPEVVNEFLLSVYEFESKFRRPTPQIRLFEKVGMPFFRKAGELADKQLTRELKRLMRLLNDNRIQLDVLGVYPDRVLYKFITEEFFYHEVDDLDLPGYVAHFCYEDFHPNHEMDIRQRAMEFLTQWLGRQINEYSWQLANSFVHPDTREFSRETVLEKIHRYFDAHAEFANCVYRIDDISFNWDDVHAGGHGTVQGVVKFDATLKTSTHRHYEGPFQLYLSNTNNWWAIFYFVFPGFSWNDQT